MATTDKPIWNTGLINNGKLEQVYELAVVRHGRWMGRSEEDTCPRCSVCGRTRFGSSLGYVREYVPYCENCGAKMDGERKEDVKTD